MQKLIDWHSDTGSEDLTVCNGIFIISFQWQFSIERVLRHSALVPASKLKVRANRNLLININCPRQAEICANKKQTRPCEEGCQGSAL